MSVTVVVGGQWGDEGKGKVVDLLAADAQLVIRAQGGSNAGHTVVVGSTEYHFHLIPSGVLSNTRCLLGNGMVIDPIQLCSEMDILHSQGVEVEKLLQISDRAHVVMPYHPALDGAQEAAKGTGKIGTTGRGIGPTYEDKIRRIGIRMGDFRNTDTLPARIRDAVTAHNQQLVTIDPVQKLDPESVVNTMMRAASRLKPMIVDSFPLLRTALAENQRLLIEGAQGTMLDIDMGTYPYVTASSPTAGGGCTGSGIPPTAVSKVIAIVKAYTTRVGEGPLPTEVSGQMETDLRARGHEYGVTTGRPRRIGWFDSAVVRYGHAINGTTAMIITKLDVLDALDQVPLCTGYTHNGALIDYPPSDITTFGAVTPIYSPYDGWKCDITGVRTEEELPANARTYVEAIAAAVECPIAAISVGPERTATVMVEPALLAWS